MTIETSPETQAHIDPQAQRETSSLKRFAETVGKLVGRRALALSMAIVSLGGVIAVGESVVDAENNPAFAAETGGYPFANAPCQFGDAGGSSCADPNNTSNKYNWFVDEDGNGKYTTPNQNQNENISERGFYYRNCTDWASYRGREATGVQVPYGTAMGNAVDWDVNGKKAGYTVDSVPEPGDIAQNDNAAGGWGHVGNVEEVMKDKDEKIIWIKISQYNGNGTGNYSIITYYPDAEGKFWLAKGQQWDDFIDLNGTGKGINGAAFSSNGIATTPSTGTSNTSNISRPIPGDFNGDGVTDMAVFRPSDGYWHVRGVGDFQYGQAGDIPVPADYNGDGKTDIAVYRPSHGGWHIRGVGDYPYGWSTDIPVPGDYNGDGKADMAVFRPSDGYWHVRGVGDFQYGQAGDIPSPGYYNNDKILDIAVYRPSHGGWHIRGVGDYPYGISTDIPVPGDYNGDGITDIAVYRPSEGGWHVRGVGDWPHGWSTDVPVPARYNNDKTTDAAIYRPDDGGWRIRAVGDYPYGWSTDIPAVQTLGASLLKRYGLIQNY